MPLIIPKENWQEWLDDPKEKDRTWTYYKCPCGEEAMSDIAFPHLFCLKCNSKMTKKEAKK